MIDLCQMKYFIISQPKAGTYLAANLLENMGITPSKLHFDPGVVRKFTTLSEFEKYNITFNMALKKELEEDQFAVGHMPYINDNIRALKGIKKILVVRDREEIKESAKRYFKEKKQNVWSIIGDKNLDSIERWSEHSGVFVMNFKDMIEKDVNKINKLQKHLFGKLKYNSLEVIEKALTQDSLTKSSIRE